MTEPDWAALTAAWRPARSAGVLGSSTIEDFVAHAAGFLPAACRVQDEFLGVDLGTGAGVPGLFLALARPRSTWILVDSNQQRCALAEAAVAALELDDRVHVRHARAEDLSAPDEFRGRVDLVVARGFGPPPEIAECALPLLNTDGSLVVSVTTQTEQQWRIATDTLIPFRLSPTRQTNEGMFLEVHAAAAVPERFPRRPPARRRQPLFDVSRETSL